MRRESHVRFCEGLRVKFPRAILQPLTFFETLQFQGGF